jgi:probable rRNA maturation factor
MNTVAADFRGIPEPAWLGSAEAFALKAVDALGHDLWDLSMLFCDDAFIAGLNREYRGKDEATDVLSFGLGEWYESETGRRYMAGDVVVCPAAMSRNAEAFGVGEDEEMRRLIVHGILHLSGMDHETNDPDEPMLLRQEELMSSLSEERIF